jgi:hypothetical protein
LPIAWADYARLSAAMHESRQQQGWSEVLPSFISAAQRPKLVDNAMQVSRHTAGCFVEDNINECRCIPMVWPHSGWAASTGIRAS